MRLSSSRQAILATICVALLTWTCSMSAQDPIFTPPVATQASEPQPVSDLSQPAQTVEPTQEINVAPPEEPTPELAPAASPTPLPLVNVPTLLYSTQSGDTLPALAVRFGVNEDEITSPELLPEGGVFLTPFQLLLIPDRLANTTSAQLLLPDSELVFSPSAIDFDVEGFVSQGGGKLAAYKEYLNTTGTTTGAEVVYRVAIENSINPRLLIALLEYQSGWVYGQPGNLAQSEYPMGIIDLDKRSLFQQLVWAVKHLSVGYYGWREGLLTEITFSDGVTARLAPTLNAGTAGLLYYFAQLYDSQRWMQALDPETGFPVLYRSMFGDPWGRAQTVEPLYPRGLVQPELILPFVKNQTWSYTGGPHGAWEHDGARAAIDFAPASTESGCVKSDAWVTAAGPGLIVRSGYGMVVVDMDGDGFEQTGWVLLYLHLSTNGRAAKGQWVERGDLLGHPSCEGGMATGTHVHVARKYNGEWISADGPLPFVLSGWMAHAGANPYEGTLTRAGETVTASVYGSYESRIRRDGDS